MRNLAQPVTDASGRIVEFVATAMDVTDLTRAAARLVRVKRRAHERSLETRFAATLEERTRLAREIHDSLLQGATGIALQLRAVLPNLGKAPTATVAAIRHIVELAESTIREARRAVWDMRSPALLQKGLPRALEEEANHTVRDLPLHFTVKGVPRRLPQVVEDTVFRVGQEAIVNAAKHSGATRVTVELEYRPRSVRLTVRDDGRGFDVDPVARGSGGRWGLLGMRERAERIDASLKISSTKGRGTTVELRVRTASQEKRRGRSTSRRLEQAS
jgi:signal transduction histidine kinase